MKEFLGLKYALTRSENFDDYLVFLGKGYLARKAAMNLRQEHCLTLNDDDNCTSNTTSIPGDTYTFSFTSLLVSASTKFKLGEEFVEVKPDGVKVKSLITIEGNTMTHIQTEENGRISKHVREFFPDKMIARTTCEGLDKTVTRYYELVQ